MTCQGCNREKNIYFAIADEISRKPIAQEWPGKDRISYVVDINGDVQRINDNDRRNKGSTD